MENGFLHALKNERMFHEGELIFRQGEAAEAFYYLVDGLVQAYTIGAGGSKRNIMTSWPGEFFGTSNFFDGSRRRSSEVALRPSRVIIISRQDYMRCRERRDFMDAVLLALSTDVRILFEQMADSALLSADVKVARFICRRVDRGQHVERDGQTLLQYSQSFVADVLGLSRWAVNKALMHMKDRGWVGTRYGGVLVLDIEAIRHFAFEEPGG